MVLGEKPAPESLANFSIYTIAHPDTLDGFSENQGGYGMLTPQKSWTKARRLLARSRRNGLELPILFADATDCRRLIYQAHRARTDVVEPATLAIRGTLEGSGAMRKATKINAVKATFCHSYVTDEEQHKFEAGRAGRECRNLRKPRSDMVF